MTRTRWIIAVLGLAGAVALTLLWLTDGGSGEGGSVDLVQDGTHAPRDTNVEAAHTRDNDTPLILIDPLAGQPDALEDETDAAAVPESYRKALAALTGRVVYDNGTPVPDMTVMLAGGRATMVRIPMSTWLTDPEAVDPSTLFDLECARDVTDVEGHFSLVDIEPRTVGLLLLDPGGPSAHWEFLDETPVSGESRDVGDIVLPGAVRFVGRVLDERGEPVQGARVRAAELPAMLGMVGLDTAAEVRAGCAFAVVEGDKSFFYQPPSYLARWEALLPIPRTFTESDGTFVLERVPQGMPTLIIDHEDYVARIEGPVPTGPAGGERDVGDQRLSDGTLLEGQVVDTNGVPVEGAEVFAGNRFAMAPVAVMKGPVFTNTLGRFEIGGLKPALGHAAARAPERHAFVVQADIVPGAVDTIIVVPRPQSLIVNVRDTENQPISGVVFRGRSLPDADMDTSEFPSFLKPQHALAAKAEEATPGTYVIEDLDPVGWELAALAPGYGAAITSVNLSEPPSPVTITLEPGAMLDVRVLRDADGEPVEHALVEIEIAKQDFPLETLRTDAAGWARFDGLPKGEASVIITHPALAVHTAEATLPAEEPLIVTLVTGGTIVGQVLEANGPPTEPIMILLARDGNDFNDASMPHFTTAAADGTFSFQNVDAGRVELQARPALDFAGGPETIVMGITQSPLAELEIDVLPGTEHRADLLLGSAFEGMETGWIHGQLLVNGHPGEGWTVMTWGRIRRTTKVGADGTFDLGRVQAGTVELYFSAHGMTMMTRGITARESVELADGERKFVPLSVVAGRVSGRILDDKNEPVTGMRVSAVLTENSRGRWGAPSGISKTDGSFEIEPVVVGNYALHTWGDGWAGTTSEPFDVRELQHVRNMEVRVHRAILVSGTVLLVGLEEKPSFMRLIARDGKNGNSDNAYVNAETGAYQFDRLSPGHWSIQLATEHGEDAFAPIEMDVLEPQTDLELTFIYTPEPEEDIDEKAAQMLESLGYVGDK